VASENSPTVRRLRLGQELRILRERKGLTVTEVADQLEWSLSKVHRIESAKTVPVTDEIMAMAELYEADEAKLVELLGLLPGHTADYWVAYGARAARLLEEEAARAEVLAAISGAFPVTIYLSDQDARAVVERAVVAWLATQDMEIVYEGHPVVMSWWKAMVARLKTKAEDNLDDGLALIGRTASLYAVDVRQAEVDKMQAEAFATVMAALEKVESAVIHSGTLLVVKHGGNVVRRELSQLDVETLRRYPILTTRPASILKELQAHSEQAAIAAELGETSHSDP
jgi:transcriptional regulator with XRE-family HTH domain